MVRTGSISFRGPTSSWCDDRSIWRELPSWNRRGGAERRGGQSRINMNFEQPPRPSGTPPVPGGEWPLAIYLCLLVLTALLVSASICLGQSDRPKPRSDQNSLIAHQELLQKTKMGRIDIYFEGDSITRRWGATDYPDLLANWKQNFFGWNAADFGWGADKVENILWRLDNGELDGVHPKVIVLLAGTNNVGNTTPTATDEAKVTDITRGIQAVLNVMREKAPEATIILTAIFPRNDNIAVMPTINKINENLSRFAGEKIRYLNINDRLADKSGKLFDGMMNPDKLHPALKGYQVWADSLKSIFRELLGPPARVDLSGANWRSCRTEPLIPS
jgi:lysophospholipase L1-like esterase